MARAGGPWIGQLGLRLALAFVGVALAAVASVILLGLVTTSMDINELTNAEQVDLAQATATGAAAAYDSAAWSREELAPLAELVARAGAGVQVMDKAGKVIVSSPNFARIGPGTERTEPVVVGGQRVGRVAIKFGDTGLGAAIMRFEAQRWQVRMGASALAAVIALVVALVVSRRITAPVDTLIKSARAHGRGDLGARAGDVRGFGEIQELAQAFDQMADATEEQERVRRNLVADVAHELRTPIAILQAGHEAMLDGLAKPTSEHLASLRDEVLRLARMVDDLQRLASAEAAALKLTLVPCDLAATAAAAVDSLADGFDAAGLTLKRRLDAVEVHCDPLRVHEITTNLLTNAMKYTPAGGNVMVETGPDEDPNSALGVLTVSDTGVGIPACELPLVSQRFFRGQLSAGVAGSGIGLTIVAELVRAHHGTMDIASEPGAGTRVTIRLPAALRDLAEGQPAT
jgi:two-component system sensor histidine kinase BaeS